MIEQRPQQTIRIVNDLGEADYIAKPVNQAEVQAYIDTHLALRQLQQLQEKNDSLSEELQEHKVQLNHLREERDKLSELVRNQSEQLGEIAANLSTSQDKPCQSLVHLLGSQVQEQLIRLVDHLDAAQTTLNINSNWGETSNLPMTVQQSIGHLQLSRKVANQTIEQVAQVLVDLDLNTASINQHDLLTVLSNREREVLTLIAEGKDNGGIATILHITASTVRTYRSRIANKLGAKNAYEFMRIAWQYAGKKSPEST